MATQWKRLAVQNDWLSGFEKSLASLFQDMGNPDPWPVFLQVVSIGMWILICMAMIYGILLPSIQSPIQKTKKEKNKEIKLPDLSPAAGWILGSIWLWSSKPEVWFIYFLHLSVWTFTALFALRLWMERSRPTGILRFQAFMVFLIPMVGAFAYTDIRQEIRMNASESWHWKTYSQYIDCIDQRLTQLEKDLHFPKPFQVWDPTFPDVTIELSLRHPDWDFTRTNDFSTRTNLAIQHGKDVEVVIVPETLHAEERNISGPLSHFPLLSPLWMTWDGYFLHQLWIDKSWKPNRYICQRGRWQAFIFMN